MGKGGGGGGSTQSTSTSYSTNIPEYAQPYVTSMLNATQQQLFNVNDQGQVTGFAPYRAYGGTYDEAGNMTAYNPAAGIAGFTPLQQQVQENVANIQTPGQFGYGSDLAAAAGEGALGTTGAAMGYGGAGMAAGQAGAGIGQGGLGYGALGSQYGQLGSTYGALGSATGQEAVGYGTTQGNLYGAMGAGYGAAGAQAGQAGQNIGTTQGLLYGQQASDYGREAAISGKLASDIGLQKGDQYGTQAAAAGQTGQNLALTQGVGYGETGAGYGAQGANIGQQALGYGAGAAGIGQQAANAAQQGFGAQAAYQAQATSPEAMQAYMNPYVAASLDPQLKLLNQQQALQNQQIAKQAVASGAYGGSRQAIAQSLNQQNYDLARQQAIAQGYNTAYQQAQQAQQYGANLGIQGLGAGTAALQAGIAGQQAGMQGVQGALAGTAQGIQGAQAGMQGVTTGLAGTAQGIQGAQAGMQGAQLGIQGAQANTQALQAAMQGSGLGLQGAQTAMQGTAQGIQGAQAGMQGAGVGLQGGALGLQGYGQGIQGAQTGVAGAQAGVQGAQTGISGVNAALAGNAQQLQGAQIGLQGVQGAQAGYGLANQAAGQLGQLGTQQLAAEQGILGLQSQVGAQEQAYQQQILNQAMQDYANAQQYPLMQLGTMSNMLRGLPLQSATTQQYIAQPNLTTQAIGTAGALGSLYNATKKKGGIIDAKKYAGGGIIGSTESKLYDMEPEELQKELQSPSGEIRKMARRIMAEKSIEGKAGGGIIAFAEGDMVPEPAPQQTATDVQFAAPNPQAPQGIVAAPTPAPAPASTGPARGQSQPAYNMAANPKEMAMRLANQAEQAGNRSIEDIYAEMQKGHAPDTARQEYRSKIMEERANAKDEDTRQNWMRAAQFFANWGSMPGNTLSAGMQALKGILPDVMSDQKEAKKYQREIDKTLYTLDEAARLEKNGQWDKAAELKQKLGEEKFKVLGPLSTMYSADVHAAATRAAAAASSGRETDMKFLYNKKLSELTDGNPGKATAAQEAEAAKWASNQSKGLPEQKLDYKKIEAANKLISDSEKSGTISQLNKERRMALIQAAPDQKATINQEYDDKVMAAKNEILNRAETPTATAPSAAPTAAVAPTGMALPSSQDQLKAGQVYNTSRGPAKWDGSKFVAS